MCIARKKRLWHPNAVYHVMGRGNRRQAIFRCKNDYLYFLDLLAHIQQKMPFEIYSYCLMTNHFHILIGTKNIEIWHIMKMLMQTYTCYFNFKYNVSGHLFQGRYHSFMVENDAYFVKTSRYIHLNPVRAKIVKRPEDYFWSSYRNMIGVRKDTLVEIERVLSYFDEPRMEAYREYVECEMEALRDEEELQRDIGEF